MTWALISWRTLPSNLSDNTGPTLVAVSSVFLGITWILAITRFYVRLYITKGWGWDDTFLLLSQLTFTVDCSSVLIGVHWGIGRHLLDINPPAHRIIAFKCWWLLEVFFVLTASFVRISVGILLFRICRAKWQRLLLCVTSAVYIAYSVFFVLLVIFQCNPVQHFWEQVGGLPGTCIAARVIPDVSMGHGGLSAFVDLILALTPLVLIGELQLNTRSKLSLLFVMALGGVAAIIAIIRVENKYFKLQRCLCYPR